MSQEYEANSLNLPSAIAMGTGVMIGAGIFALTGQIAELSGAWFPAVFVIAAIVSAFSAYSYTRMASAFPSAGGIAMFLNKAYGRGVITGSCAILMVLSMVINESLVARTFGTYALQPFDLPEDSVWVPVLGLGLISLAFIVNAARNKWISAISLVSAFLKIGGILIFSAVTIWASDFQFAPFQQGQNDGSGGSGITDTLAAVALGILAYKGFTTITNSGDELQNPQQNIGRAIFSSLLICTVVYGFVSWAVGSNLSIEEISNAKDYALAEAARPVVGQFGLWFTVAIAIIATASGLLASIFAVSRMLAMLTEMELVPHRHFGLPGSIHFHTLIYTVVIAGALTAFLDLSRIASLGAIFYLVMDIAVHWGVLRHLREQVSAKPWILITAIVLDAVILAAFIFAKLGSDPIVVYSGLGGIAAVIAFEAAFLKRHPQGHSGDPNYHLDQD